jgi:hypothetical protein
MRPAERALLDLADPCRPPRAVPALDAPGVAELLSLAQAHGVLPAVVENLTAGPEAPGRIESLGAGPALERARQRVLEQVGLSMLLTHQWERLAQAAHGRLRLMPLKGPDFARRLYPRASLRTFRDLDVLVAPADVPAAEALLAEQGYTTDDTHTMKYDDGYAQRTYRPRDGRGGGVELHWNLVNSPTIRRRISLALDDLELDDAALPTPATRLLMTAVHAATSHGFDRLQLLCDVAQAVRAAGGAVDVSSLRRQLARCGGGLAMASSLRLAGAMLRERRCGELARELGLREPLSARWLIRPVIVLRSGGGWGSLLRQGYREVLKRRRVRVR